MKKLWVLLTTVIAIFVYSYEVQAEIKEKGFFLGGGLSYAWENFDDDDLEGTGVNVDIDDAWGFNLFTGYRFIKYLALEANFNWYDGFKVEVGPVDFDIDIWTLMLDAKGMYPVYNVVPYLRLGGGYMDAETDESGINADDQDFAWNLGAGVDYFVSDRVRLGLDGKYVWGSGDLDDLEYFVGTFTVGFHF